MGKETEQKQEIVNQGVHTYSQEEAYVWPEEPVLREQLEWFQDQKLALMVHWGVYNQLGMVASWALSDEDAEWSRKTVDWTDDGEVFKRQYRALNRAFDPVAFQPEEWAKMAKECGFRYLILTTKHHDGFCLWDTAYTEYKTTAEDCPFHTHKYADIVRAMFDAFRKEKLGIGVYYSKADWHCPDYWEKEKVFTGKTTRNPTYNPKENPEAWERFRAFTRDQILELGKQYGRLDILWFDAGWVAATNGQDIRLGEIVEEVRKTQPWVLTVDRTVGGAYENYVTPEMCVPEKSLRVPWESCLTLGADFNYAYGDHYKSPRELVNLLVNIVAKGGNMALNVSPQPDGRIPVEAWESLRGLGAWMQTYGEAIYGTRICAPYQSGNLAFTQKGDVVYVIRLYPEEREAVEEKLLIPYQGKIRGISMVDTKKEDEWKMTEEGIQVVIPQEYREGETPIAIVWKIEQ